MRNEIQIPHVIVCKNRALGCVACIYTYAGARDSVLELSSSSAGTGGILGSGGACHGVGASVPLQLQCVWVFFVGPFGRGRQPSI